MSSRAIRLHKTVGVKVGAGKGIQVGGGAPIVVQSMTMTDTADARGTAEQCIQLAEAGSEMVRVTVNLPEAAAAVPEIKQRMLDAGCTAPLIGDFHYNGHILLTKFPDCASALDKYRINPGNVGTGVRRDEQFSTICKVAVDHGKPVRIGVNGGSLNQDLVVSKMQENTDRNLGKTSEDIINECMVLSAVESTALALECGLRKDQIIISCKTSRPPDLIAVYRALARATDQPLHLGLTEAGMGTKGLVWSAAAMGVLLNEGIGDTIRVSLTPRPGGDRREEVYAACEMLQALGLRAFSPSVTACPGCGRTTSSTFQELAERTQDYIRERMPEWKTRYEGVENLTLAVMGCIVNGPGESKAANIGISLPGTGEAPNCPIYIDGEHVKTLRGTYAELAGEFQRLVDDYVEHKYAAADDRLREVLHSVWGFSDFRPLQREAMHTILAGRDSVVVLPTGGGKSLCFQAPALVDVAQPFRVASKGNAEASHYKGNAEALPHNGRRGFALVVSPLISLMKDQVDGLRVDGVEAAYLNSSLTSRERDEVLLSLREDRCRLLYVSPERLVGEGSQGFRRMLQQTGVRFVAIDEAHCISQWGHDFRPEYRQLGCLRDDFPDASIHAFTATATGRVRQDIVRELRLANPEVLVGSFDRPNLTYRVLRRSNFHKQLLQILSRHEDEAGIVYCSSRREVETLAEWLQSEGHKALPYHAGLSDDVRSRNQEDFLDERVDIIVATVAFGMGIDWSNVRFVVHAGFPRLPEHYQQESGRAGRDGLPAECVLAYSGADFARWRQMLESNGEWNDSARTLLRDMEHYAAGTRCRHKTLVEYFGEKYERAECGACDWCLKELDAVGDSTTIARKILSCVARVKQTWGIGHVADVLMGKASDKILASRHQELSTFGLLKDESSAAIRGYIEQLIGDGLLLRDGDPYPVLRLTASGLTMLKGEGECTLYREVAPPRERKRGKRDGKAASYGVDADLFDVLRQVRLRLARERGVPPYVIFHDRSLQEMADRRPKTIADLHDIYGVGERKAAAFGDAFLDAIREFRRQDLSPGAGSP